MNLKNRKPLGERVTSAAETALAEQGFVAPIDVLSGIGWFDPNLEKQWRLGQIEAMELTIQTHPSRITEAMQLFRAWAEAKGLLPSEAPYVARTPQRQNLRFSRSGDAAIERAYRTHWVSPELSERKREKLKEKASKPPELVVVQPLKDGWVCHRCGGTGSLLIMEPPGPACLKCVGLDDLEFLPAGDAKVTRRSKANSARSAVVVRFSKTRGRYERQGLLVEAKALAEAEGEEK